MYDRLAYHFPQQAVVQSRITEQIFSRVSNKRALYIKIFFSLYVLLYLEQISTRRPYLLPYIWKTDLGVDHYAKRARLLLCLSFTL